MNTSDRSIALLDIALRRRFTFIEIMPDPELLKNTTIEGINLGELLENINEKITNLIGRDYQLGHSYLMNIEDIEALEFRWYYQIIPLLQEYFYNNCQQLSIILGSDFVKVENSQISEFDLQSSYNIQKLSENDLVDALSKLIN